MTGWAKIRGGSGEDAPPTFIIIVFEMSKFGTYPTMNFGALLGDVNLIYVHFVVCLMFIYCSLFDLCGVVYDVGYIV